MNTKPDMTIPEATGYIVGVVMGLVRKFDKFFVIVLACAVCLFRVRITYDLPSDPDAWRDGLIEGALAAGIFLWILHGKPRE
jgi:hypothetical protein